MMPRIVTIDGPAGTGKSTVARKVAAELGFVFLDTGAIYRTCALAVHLLNENIDDEVVCSQIVSRLDIKLDGTKVFLNGNDVSMDIRSNFISTLSSKIAAHPMVRNALLDMQRSFGKQTSIVAEGRDTGSVVFPYADVKIYLDASPDVRAQRRHFELKSNGIEIPYEQVLKDVTERDIRDKSRKLNPLHIPNDATVVNTTHMFLDQVISEVLNIVRRKLAD